MWEGYSIEDVATPEGWRKVQLVLDFYNERRKQGLTAQPNTAHLILAELEDYFDVQIITQNVDNLHEKAGSTNVLHLHGELYKSRSTKNPKLIYDIEGWELNLGKDKCELGKSVTSPYRLVSRGSSDDGTSRRTHRTGRYFYCSGDFVGRIWQWVWCITYGPRSPIFVVDPKTPEMSGSMKYVTLFPEKATVGMTILKEKLLREYV